MVVVSFVMLVFRGVCSFCVVKESMHFSLALWDPAIFGRVQFLKNASGSVKPGDG